MNVRTKRLATAALVLAAALAAAAFWWAGELTAPGPLASTRRVVVADGASMRSVLSQLAAEGALRHPRLLEYWLRLTGGGAFRSGTYDLAARTSAAQLAAQLRAGKFAYEEVRIIEGWTFAEMRELIDASPYLRHDTRGLSNAELMALLEHPGEQPEGRFFPSTYRFVIGSSDRAVYRLAYDRLQSELSSAWAGRASGLPLSTPEQALILASIVEKESGREDERPLVAAVFVNRLRIGMRLQSDPTVIYGLGDRYDGNLHARDLTTDTPYNTRTRAGLPPTPIALVSRAALHATLHPADSKAMYFVATGEGDGRHHFSETYAEHLRAVRRLVQRTSGPG